MSAAFTTRFFGPLGSLPAETWSGN